MIARGRGGTLPFVVVILAGSFLLFLIQPMIARMALLLLLAAAWLPIGLGGRQLPVGAEPALWVPWLLARAIGPLFFAVSAQAPLLQRRGGGRAQPLCALCGIIAGYQECPSVD